MISLFRGEHRWLSNFWLIPIEYEGLVYPSAEHAYQAAKIVSNRIFERVKFQTGTPGDAKRMGRQIHIRADWNQVKLQVMEDIVRLKFKKGGYLAQRLIDTGQQELVEGNTWGDKYWGQCPVGVGENHLGKILMKIRKELQS